MSQELDVDRGRLGQWGHVGGFGQELMFELLDWEGA